VLIPYNFICVRTGSILSEISSLDDIFSWGDSGSAVGPSPHGSAARSRDQALRRGSPQGGRQWTERIRSGRNDKPGTDVLRY
ncbi:hypothetical protein KUCAC02_035943, partial [Chaenocephalus aceratus]